MYNVSLKIKIKDYEPKLDIIPYNNFLVICTYNDKSIKIPFIQNEGDYFKLNFKNVSTNVKYKISVYNLTDSSLIGIREIIIPIYKLFIDGSSFVLEEKYKLIMSSKTKRKMFGNVLNFCDIYLLIHNNIYIEHQKNFYQKSDSKTHGVDGKITKYQILLTNNTINNNNFINNYNADPNTFLLNKSNSVCSTDRKQKSSAIKNDIDSEIKKKFNKQRIIEHKMQGYKLIDFQNIKKNVPIGLNYFKSYNEKELNRFRETKSKTEGRNKIKDFEIISKSKKHKGSEYRIKAFKNDYQNSALNTNENKNKSQKDILLNGDNINISKILSKKSKNEKNDKNDKTNEVLINTLKYEQKTIDKEIYKKPEIKFSFTNKSNTESNLKEKKQDHEKIKFKNKNIQMSYKNILFDFLDFDFSINKHNLENEKPKYELIKEKLKNNIIKVLDFIKTVNTENKILTKKYDDLVNKIKLYTEINNNLKMQKNLLTEKMAATNVKKFIHVNVYSKLNNNVIETLNKIKYKEGNIISAIFIKDQKLNETKPEEQNKTNEISNAEKLKLLLNVARKLVEKFGNISQIYENLNKNKIFLKSLLLRYKIREKAENDKDTINIKAYSENKDQNISTAEVLNKAKMLMKITTDKIEKENLQNKIIKEEDEEYEEDEKNDKQNNSVKDKMNETENKSSSSNSPRKCRSLSTSIKKENKIVVRKYSYTPQNIEKNFRNSYSYRAKENNEISTKLNE